MARAGTHPAPALVADRVDAVNAPLFPATRRKDSGARDGPAPWISVTAIPSDGFSADTIFVGLTAIPMWPDAPMPAQTHRSPGPGVFTFVPYPT